MKRNYKYIGIIILFILGLSLGSIKKTNVDYSINEEISDEKTAVYDVEKNTFMRLGHMGEVFIDESFGFILDVSGEIIGFLFGM